MSKKITIYTKTGMDNCDTCGIYRTFEVKVDIAGEKQLNLYGDNHLAGGVQNEQDVLEKILEELGYSVEWEIEDGHSHEEIKN